MLGLELYCELSEAAVGWDFGFCLLMMEIVAKFEFHYVSYSMDNDADSGFGSDLSD